MNMRKIEGKLF